MSDRQDRFADVEPDPETQAFLDAMDELVQLRAERRLSVRLFDDCENYAEHPGCSYSAVCIKGYLHCNKCGLIEKDPTCDGTGRVLRKGAYLSDSRDDLIVVIVPASWMEADNA